jgi:hypothetical protein
MVEPLKPKKVPKKLPNLEKNLADLVSSKPLSLAIISQMKYLKGLPFFANSKFLNKDWKLNK